MATIVTRAGKGSPLTHDEVDANFENLNTDKVETNSSPTLTGLTVDGTDTEVLITEDSEGSATLRFADTQADPYQSYAIAYDTSANKANFKINDTQRANFNASGDYMVGPATTDNPFVIYTANNDATKAGVGLRQTGYIAAARMNDHAMMLNRMGSDGLTMGIRNDGTFVGGFGNTGGELTFHDSTSAEAMRLDSSGRLGIGTNNPSTALDVDGTVTATAFAGDGAALTGISGGIAYTRHTANVTMEANEGVIADTTGGAFTVTLPASPAVGDTVVIADGGDWATTNLTVGRNGSTIEGDAADMTMNIGGVAVQFTYDGTTWQIYTQLGAAGGNVVSEGDSPTFGTVTATSLVVNGNNYPSAGPLSNRNLIINGAMQVAQRGTSFSISTSGYTLDRWQVDAGASGTVAVTQEAFTLGQTDVPDEPKNYMRVTLTGLPADAKIIQPVEGVRTLAGQTCTLSFWAKADSAKTIAEGGYFIQNFGSGGSSNVNINIGAWSVTTSWQKITITTTLPSISGKTIGSGNCLQVRLDPNNGENVVLDIANVQLEVGNTATPFEHRSYGQELARCQRYYHRTDTTTSAPYKRYYNTTGSFGAAQVSYDYPVTMRAAPTLQVYGDVSGGTQSLLGAAGSFSAKHGFSVFTNINNGAYLDYHYHTADAEL